MEKKSAEEKIFNSADITTPVGGLSIDDRKVSLKEVGIPGLIKGSISFTLPKWASVVSWWHRHHAPDFEKKAAEELRALSTATANFILHYMESTLPTSAPKSLSRRTSPDAPYLTQEMVQKDIKGRGLGINRLHESDWMETGRLADLASILLSMSKAQQKVQTFKNVWIDAFRYQSGEDVIGLESLAVLAKPVADTLKKWADFDEGKVVNIKRQDIADRFNQLAILLPTAATTNFNTVYDLLEKSVDDDHYWKKLAKETPVDTGLTVTLNRFLLEKKRSMVYLSDVDATEMLLIDELYRELPPEDQEKIRPLLARGVLSAQGQYDQAELLIKAAVEARSRNGRPAGRMDVIPDNIQKKYGPELLFIATFHDWADVVQGGVKSLGGVADWKTESGGGMVSYAFKRCSLGTLDYFLANHQDLLDEEGFNGGNAYHTALLSENAAGTIATMEWIKKNMNPGMDKKNRNGTVPLASALFSRIEGAPGVAKWIIKNGADVDGVCPDGDMLLNVAKEKAASCRTGGEKAGWEDVVEEMKRRSVPGVAGFNTQEFLRNKAIRDSLQKNVDLSSRKATPSPAVDVIKENPLDRAAAISYENSISYIHDAGKGVSMIVPAIDGLGKWHAAATVTPAKTAENRRSPVPG